MAKTPSPNRYPGNCKCCTAHVPAGAGFLGGKVDGRWTVQCSPCATGQPTPATGKQPAIAYDLTSEQQEALAAFQEGVNIAVQAGAGAGKTSLLLAIGQSTTRRGQYLAFNTKIVEEAAAKFGAVAPNVRCSTINSVAWQGGGSVFKDRLNAARQSGTQIAHQLGIQPLTLHLESGDDKVLQPKTLAAYVLKAISAFCQSADLKPSARKHAPFIAGIDKAGPRLGRSERSNNRIVQDHLEPAVQAAWRDLKSPKGQLAVGRSTIHDVYVKLFALSDDCNIPAEFILVDEAQDLAPVQLQILEKQRGKQIVIVGDSQQAIYGWRGAVDALDRFPSERTCFLTNSFRFGPEVASVANEILSTIPGAELRIVGRGESGTVGPHSSPDAILTRSNAGAIRAVLSAQAQGLKPFLVGGSADVVAFCQSAEDLQGGRGTSYPELACFSNWDEVCDYVDNDPNGGDLKVLVKLINDHGVETIIEAVSNRYSAEEADVVVSTAHKSKGLQWPVVQIAGDFPQSDSAEELRLLYVAVTRAQKHLDYSACDAVHNILDGGAKTNSNEED